MAEEDGFPVRDHQTGASDAETGLPQQGPGAGAQKPSDQGAPHEVPSAQALDFSIFVISLATSAQVGLGAVPHPETSQTAQNFSAAKQMIDILALLKEKTKGNLTEDESSLLEQVQHSLRIHYVRAMEEQKKSGE